MTMKTIHALLVRCHGLFRRRTLEAEMNEEMRAHLEGLVERNLAAGMTATEARHAALRTFGGVEQIKERARDARGFVWLEQGLQDFRHAVRTLGKSPIFALVAIGSLAIGIGANIAMFGWGETMVWRTLPVVEPHELVQLGWQRTAAGGAPRRESGDEIEVDSPGSEPFRHVFSWTAFERMRVAAEPAAEVLGLALIEQPTLTIDGQPERLDTSYLVSGNYHAVLGVRARLGRTLRPEDDRPGAAPVIVISHRYWERRFARDPAIIGRSVLLNRTPVTIVGVTEPGFSGPISGRTGPVTASLVLAEQIYPEAGELPLRSAEYWWLRLMGRMKPGVAREQVRTVLESVFRDSAEPGWNKPDALPRLIVNPGAYGRSERARRENLAGLAPLAILVGLLLVVACANLANLLLARGLARRREFAVRLALGAGRSRLVRQLLTENIVVALAGAAGGLLLAVWAFDLLAANLFPPWEDAQEMALRLDWRVMGFSGGLAVLTAIVSGLVPAWRATRLDLTAEFQGGARALGGGRSRLSRGLMIVQMALSFVLLVVAGLLVGTVRNLGAVDIGFDRERLLLFSVNGVEPGPADAPRLDALYQRITGRIATIAGVRGVSYSRTPVLKSDSGEMLAFQRVDDPNPPVTRPEARWNQVETSFFDVYGLPFVLGRSFTLADVTGAGVAVVNQAFAAKYFSQENPLGRHLAVGRGRNAREVGIVGVVRDFRQKDLRSEIPPTIYTLVPTRTTRETVRPLREANFVVRTHLAPEALVGTIRRAVAEIDPHVPLARLSTQAEQIEWTVAEERLIERLATFLGVAALVLASVGLYGLMTYGVMRRTNEIGVRMALGALPRQVLAMIVGESLGLVTIGIVVGVCAALAAVRLLASTLFGLSTTDIPTFAAAMLLLWLVAIMAALFPARRATRIDPMVALRSE